ncbi:MAG: enoyl-CoA hydratase-related protein, partial [Pseudomonadota bacterium]
AEAAALGIINRVFPDSDFREQARAYALRIAQGPTTALRFMKKNIHTAATRDLATTMDLEADHMLRAFATEDSREAIAAFREKRPPTFRGR